MGTRILIIKLDAIGDVARTTCLLPALAKKHRVMHVTWLVAPEGVDLLRDNPLIDVVLPYDAASLERLRVEQFDILLSLDKTARACAVAETVKARERRGFGLSEFGTVYPIDKDAEYAFELGLSDELKFRKNTRTYQDVLFEIAGMKFDGEEYCLPLTDADRAFEKEFCERHQIPTSDTVIGLNLGGGGAFANKMWGAERCIEFAHALRKAMPQAWLLLFGAEREREKMEQVAVCSGPKVINTGVGNTIKQFQALLGRCNAVITGDSLGMHLALAEKRPVIALFGPTCAAEIELYGRGVKIVSPAECVPCYKGVCQESLTCMDAIRVDEVLDAVKSVLGRQSSLTPTAGRGAT
jgi:heptosyltransferase-2